MADTIFEKIRRAMSAFNGRDPTRYRVSPDVEAATFRPDKLRTTFRYGDKTYITAIKNRIAMDCAKLTIEHVKLDDKGNYEETVDSTLNDILTVEANKDQTARSFIQDIIYSMLDEGVVVVVPTYIEKSRKPRTYLFEPTAMRVAKVVQWYPDAIMVEVYDDETGKYRHCLYNKWECAIIENPLSAVMNEPNSILKRLLNKLSLLDVIDEQSGAGKLDLIIQLPYTIKTEARRVQAETRRKDIEMQLSGSKYGIAYTDGTERITQLNRPVENNLMNQIEYLTNTLYGQLGVTQGVFDGTADELTMLNYYDRTIEPIVAAMVDEFKRKFLTEYARKKEHMSIVFRRDPFSLVTAEKFAELADKLTRNEILSSNELRAKLGYKASDDGKSDMLINSNLNHENEGLYGEQPNLNKEENQNE